MIDYEIQKQRTYYARRELGLCVKCGMTVEEPKKFKVCYTCREKQRIFQSTDEKRAWRREYQRHYRDEMKRVLGRIAIEVQKLSEAESLQTDRKSISKTHKCWDCVWSRWHGDRFFCPLIGCVKGPIKQEAAIENDHT